MATDNPLLASDGERKYGDRLLGLIDKCLAMNFIERPKGATEFIALFQVNRDHPLYDAIRDTSLKMDPTGESLAQKVMAKANSRVRFGEVGVEDYSVHSGWGCSIKFHNG